MKNIKKIILTLSCVLFMGSLSSSFAACAIPCGWYLDANVGTGQISDTNYGSGSSLSNNGVGVNINGGYKFMPYFATEAGYTRYSNSTIKIASTNVATLKNYAWDIALKGILPIYETNFELFAKLGAARLTSQLSLNSSAVAQGFTLTSSRSRTASSLFLGAGANYTLTPRVPIILQWIRARGDNTSGHADFYSVGIGYYFG